MAMPVTPAQTRMIFVLARQRGLDGELLHIHAENVCGKKSLKSLTIMDAKKLIDSLQAGTGEEPRGMMTVPQYRYIEGLMTELGWTDERGKIDAARYKSFLKSRFSIDAPEWVDSRAAGKVIEALKAMTARKRAGEDIDAGSAAV